MKHSGISDYTWLSSQPYPFRHSPIFQIPGTPTIWYWCIKMMPRVLRKYLFRKFFRLTDTYLSVLSAASSAEYYVDGSKSLTRLELLRSHYDTIRVIHLVKDPRSFIHSCVSKYAPESHYKFLLWGWMLYNTWAHAYQRILGKDRYFFVYYHQLSRDPENVLQRILQFIGFNSAIIRSDSIDMTQQHILGNSMRLSFHGVENRPPQWREYLSAEIIQDIEKSIKTMKWLTLE